LSAHLGKITTYILLTIFLTPCVSADEISAVPGRLVIPSGTPIKLSLAATISSAHARVGDPVDLIVARDVDLGGFTIIQAGTTARGHISGVKSKRFFGVGGRVSLQVDSVGLATGDRVRLSARKEVKGRSRTKIIVGGMIATSLVFLPATPLFLLLRGHDGTVVKTTEITAQIDDPTSVLSADLARSRESSSELAEFMNFLPSRVFTGEGREGDMLNLVFVARQEDLQEAFQRAGWVKTDKFRPVFAWHLMCHRTTDTRLPMARFYLFGRVQDYSYALPDPNAIVTSRHHLRIWKTDYAIDGTPIWASAATHDVAIEIAKRGRLIDHRIDPEVDAERDFVGTNLAKTASVGREEYLHPVTPVFKAQTATGETYYSDGRILLLDFHQIPRNTSGAPQSSTVVQTAPLPLATAAKPPQ
jgi:hypothetical protein